MSDVGPTSKSDILIDLRRAMQPMARITEPQTKRFLRSARMVAVDDAWPVAGCLR